MKGMFRPISAWWSDLLGSRQYLRHQEKKDRRRRLTAQALTLLTMAAGIYYLAWHWMHINWEAWYYAPLFFAAEVIGFLLFSFFSFNAWFLRYHAPEGLTPKTSYSLDVFIPVAGEPLELVRKTLEAAVLIRFENKNVYVLDDRAEDRYRELAEQNGCHYFARPDHDHAKAGNMNYALSRTGGDLILTLDADQVPEPDIVERLLGYFELPRIAFVQTKQCFDVPDGDPFGNSDRIFYDVMQSGKDNDNSAFSCGSGVMYRRKALEEIGGFSTWNIVEDVHTSMLLQERGWRSIYYNYPVTRGTAPADIYGVYRQRRQWAADSLRILFWDNPFLHKGLTLKQKLQYTHLGFVYLVAAFTMPFFYITPIIALLTSKFVLDAPVASYVIHRFPYFLVMSLAYGIINYPTSYMRAFQMWTGLFPVFIQATWIALTSRKVKPAYHVNAKTVGTRTKTRSPLAAIIPQLTIIGLGIFAAVYAFFRTDGDWDFYLLNVVWVCWSIWTMSGICFAAVARHRWTEAEVEAPRQERLGIPFFRFREMAATAVLSVAVTVFFVFADHAKVERYMSSLRTGVEDFMAMKQPAKSPDVDERRMEEGQGKAPERAADSPVSQ